MVPVTSIYVEQRWLCNIDRTTMMTGEPDLSLLLVAGLPRSAGLTTDRHTLWAYTSGLQARNSDPARCGALFYTSLAAKDILLA